MHHLPDRAAVGGDARAYGGPAHGREWAVDPVEPPPWVELPTGFSSSLYRLARHPRTGQPARDYVGNLLYVPLTDGVPSAGTRDAARSLVLPRTGHTGCRSGPAGEDAEDTHRDGSGAPGSGRPGA